MTDPSTGKSAPAIIGTDHDDSPEGLPPLARQLLDLRGQRMPAGRCAAVLGPGTRPAPSVK
jgi:hypothetical protein